MKLLEKLRGKRNYVNKEEKSVISRRRETIFYEYKTFLAQMEGKIYTVTVYFENEEKRKEEITEFVRENCNRGTIALILETDVRYDLRLETHRNMRENEISLFFSEM